MKILEDLRGYFGQANVSVIYPDHLLRCDRSDSNGTVYQIVYLDYSDDWTRPAGLTIDRAVIEHYYGLPGFLQWNFYYYYITSEQDIDRFKEQKRTVESNQDYARKFVTTEAQFLDLLKSTRDISDHVEHGKDKDIYKQWVSYLKEHSLSFVINEKQYPNYASNVENYLNGEVFSDFNEPVIDNDISESRLFEIKQLNIKKYRLYPTTQNLELGKVNLIHGPNAVGKTSLLDCLELVLTGQNFQKNNDETYEMELVDNDNTLYAYPDKSSPYKSRDFNWYKSWLAKGNNLNNNFNKFNYYNSDAAFRLKMEDDNDNNNLMKVMTDIALGKEVNILEERIEGFKDRFQSKLTQLRNESTHLNAELKDKNDTIEEVKKQTTEPEGSKYLLQRSLEENKWLIKLNSASENYVAAFSETLKTIELASRKIVEINCYIKVVSRNEVNRELQQLKAKDFSYNELQNDLLDCSKEILRLTTVIDAQQQINSYFLELKPYFQHPAFKYFRGLPDLILTKTNQLNDAKEIIRLRKAISNEGLFTGARQEPIEVFIRQSTANVDWADRALSANELAISEIENGITSLNKIISNLKSAGLQFLSHQKYNGHCPLCNSDIEKTELLSAIESARDDFEKSDSLLHLKSERSNLLEQRERAQEILQQGRVIEKLAFILYREPHSLPTVGEILDGSRLREEGADALLSELLKLNTLSSQFQTENLDQAKFESLYAKLSESVAKQVNLTEDFENALASSATDLKRSLILHEKAFEKKNNIEQQIDALFDSRIKDSQELTKFIYDFQSAYNHFNTLGLYLNLEDDPDIYSINQRVLNVTSSFAAHKKAIDDQLQGLETIYIINKQRTAILEKIKELNPKIERAKAAYEQLVVLTEKYNKNQFLFDYIETNKKDLVNIFKFIHSPKEFDDIEFNAGKIELKSKTGRKTLNQISTGQRSALALSIFLGLNKKIFSGPNLILFDDPLSYVDDLNILSFFDYLRELVTGSKKQLFFATANDDVAFLFKKKFEFLGENEFTEIELSRAD
jgi:DNA repair protein SbcC/Rad50